MNYKISIKNYKEEILYKGYILDIPIKEQYIVKKSIEIFNDDDPCIIHKSYVIKKIVDDLVKYLLFKKENKIKLSSCDKSKFDFLDIPNIEESILYFEGGL